MSPSQKRASWKPDIERLSHQEDQPLREYVASYISTQHPSLLDDEKLKVITAVLDLTLHKKPRASILEIGDEFRCEERLWPELERDGKQLTKQWKWSTAQIEEGGQIKFNDAEQDGNKFDLILISEDPETDKIWHNKAKTLTSLVAENGSILCPKSPGVESAAAAASGLTMLGIDEHMVLLVETVQPKPQERDIVILVHDPTSVIEELANTLALYLEQNVQGFSTRITHLTSLQKEAATIETSPSQTTTYISTLGMDPSSLAQLSDTDASTLRQLVASTDKDMLWLTCDESGSSTTLPSEKLASTGSIMAETEAKMDSLTKGMKVVDLGPTEDLMPALLPTCQNIAKAINVGENVAAKDGNLVGDQGAEIEAGKEFVQSNRMMYVGRMVSEQQMDSLSRKKNAAAA